MRMGCTTLGLVRLHFVMLPFAGCENHCSILGSVSRTLSLSSGQFKGLVLWEWCAREAVGGLVAWQSGDGVLNATCSQWMTPKKMGVDPDTPGFD